MLPLRLGSTDKSSKQTRHGRVFFGQLKGRPSNAINVGRTMTGILYCESNATATLFLIFSSLMTPPSCAMETMTRTIGAGSSFHRISFRQFNIPGTSSLDGSNSDLKAGAFHSLFETRLRTSSWAAVSSSLLMIMLRTCLTGPIDHIVVAELLRRLSPGYALSHLKNSVFVGWRSSLILTISVRGE